MQINRPDIITLDNGDLLAQKAAAATVSEQAGEIVAMVSTPSVDSYGDIIVQGPNDKGRGWMLDRFNGAPVMLWSHDITKPNLSAPETRAAVRKHAKFGEALFLEPAKFDAGDQAAVELEGKIRRGVIKENSVGFVSKKSEFIRDDRDYVTGIKFFEQELLELSWANRGANPDTTTMFKTMLAAHPDLAARVSVTDDMAAEWAKRDMMATVEALADRLRTLEALVIGHGKTIDMMKDSGAAEQVVRARADQSAAIDAMLRKLGK